MAPIIADNLIESGCEFVDNSNTATTNNNQISETFYSEEVEEEESFENVTSSESVVNVEESVNDEVNNFYSSNGINDESNGTFVSSAKEKKQMPWEAPGKQGLYDPQNEHEACGVGFIVAIDGKRSHKVSDV